MQCNKIFKTAMELLMYVANDHRSNINVFVLQERVSGSFNEEKLDPATALVSVIMHPPRGSRASPRQSTWGEGGKQPNPPHPELKPQGSKSRGVAPIGATQGVL